MQMRGRARVMHIRDFTVFVTQLYSFRYSTMQFRYSFRYSLSNVVHNHLGTSTCGPVLVLSIVQQGKAQINGCVYYYYLSILVRV